MSQRQKISLISPHFRCEKLDEPSVEDLIDVLEDRVVYWLLEPAQQLVDHPFRQVAAFSLLLTYFEGIWTYVKGRDSKKNPRHFFEEGFVDVFRHGAMPPSLLKRVAGVFYKDARCGFFHDGLFRERIYFGRARDGPFSVTLPRIKGRIVVEGNIESIEVNPSKFIIYIEQHFQNFVACLRDPSQTKARSRFWRFCRKKWDWEGEPRIIGG